MATAINPVTGNLIKSKGANDKYRAGFDDIDWSIKSDPPTETTHHLKQYSDVSEAEMKEYIATGTIKKD